MVTASNSHTRAWPDAAWKGCTSKSVTELIELATILTDHPEAADARAALSRIANEVLADRSDAIIEQALHAAPSCEIAQTLRRAVEAASERVVIDRDGVRVALSLFVIPIIATFHEDVPESQFESAVNRLNGLRALATKGQNDRLGPTQVTLLPQLFRLDDLHNMPMSMVRDRGIAFGTRAVNGDSEWHPSPTTGWGLKRSTAFLRFVVGQRAVFEDENWIANEGPLCAHLRYMTSQAIGRYLGSPCDVQALHTGSFYEGLYAGMWVYQEIRLDHVARATRAQTRITKRLEARVVTCAHGSRFELWLGFFTGERPVGAHGYQLRSRPSEDPRGCVSRIASRLEAAGIKANALTEAVPNEQWMQQAVQPAMFSVPI